MEVAFLRTNFLLLDLLLFPDADSLSMVTETEQERKKDHQVAIPKIICISQFLHVLSFLDITPNGSLRRRRSRVLSEDDEGNLMEFLRTSGNDNNRERKSWGSLGLYIMTFFFTFNIWKVLDRSWARKARGSGPRKRPALLTADFSSERERPSSPSPLTENKPILSAPEEEAKPKEWRQKIESWLQANESDQTSDEQRRQARRLTNRRSFEMDSGRRNISIFLFFKNNIRLMYFLPFDIKRIN